MARNTLPSLIGLVAWIALCFLTAYIGGLGSVGAGHFYAQLNQPAWAPPTWLFAPVWTLLYLLMGIAAWRVWNVAGFAPGPARRGLALFIAQLAVNALWSWLFFAWRQGALAFAGIVVLWILIAATLVAFWRVRTMAGILLLPYFAWVTFAAALTWTVWRANPLLLGG